MLILSGVVSKKRCENRRRYDLADNWVCRLGITHSIKSDVTRVISFSKPPEAFIVDEVDSDATLAYARAFQAAVDISRALDDLALVLR